MECFRKEDNIGKNCSRCADAYEDGIYGADR